MGEFQMVFQHLGCDPIAPVKTGVVYGLALLVFILTSRNAFYKKKKALPVRLSIDRTDSERREGDSAMRGQLKIPFFASSL